MDTLRENIRENGLIWPIYYFEGRILDGHKRRIAAIETGRPVKIYKLTSRNEAASVLFSFHPRRALERFPASNIIAASQLYSVPLKALAKYFIPAKKNYPERRRTGARTSRPELDNKPRMVSFYASETLLDNAKNRAVELNLNKSQFYRAAILLALKEPSLLNHYLLVSRLDKNPSLAD